MAEGLSSGAVLEGRYRLERRLGEGGMGVVWASSHAITGRRVAIKILKGAGDRPSVRRRFLREARAISMLDHPSAVRLLDAFELSDGTPALVMELVDGETLAARIARGRLSLEETAAVMVPMASVVAAAHARGIVHRDLKPENVLLSNDSDPMRRVRVLDFGIAKLAPDDGAARETTTRVGALVGTPCYMAPEQAFGDTDLDHRVDVWALGVIAYEALTGGRPYEADHIGQLVKRMLSDAIIPLEEVVEGIPDDVASLVSRMLARDRDERPRDLAEVAEVFGRHAQVTLSDPDRAHRRAPPWRLAPRRARATTLLAGCSIAAGTLAWVVFAAERPAATAEASSLSPVLETAAPVMEPPPPPALTASAAATTAEPPVSRAPPSRPAARAPRKEAPRPPAPPPPTASRPGLVTEPPY